MFQDNSYSDAEELQMTFALFSVNIICIEYHVIMVVYFSGLIKIYQFKTLSFVPETFVMNLYKFGL